MAVVIVLAVQELEAFVGEVNSMLQHGPDTVNPAYRVRTLSADMRVCGCVCMLF